MAHKLARILWHMLKFKEAFNPEIFAKEEAKLKKRKLARPTRWPHSSTTNSSPNPENQRLARLFFRRRRVLS